MQMSFTNVKEAIERLLQTALKAGVPHEDHLICIAAQGAIVEVLESKDKVNHDLIKQSNDMLKQISTVKADGSDKAKKLQEEIDHLKAELEVFHNLREINARHLPPPILSIPVPREELEEEIRKDAEAQIADEIAFDNEFPNGKVD